MSSDGQIDGCRWLILSLAGTPWAISYRFRRVLLYELHYQHCDVVWFKVSCFLVGLPAGDVDETTRRTTWWAVMIRAEEDPFPSQGLDVHGAHSALLHSFPVNQPLWVHWKASLVCYKNPSSGAITGALCTSCASSECMVQHANELMQSHRWCN